MVLVVILDGFDFLYEFIIILEFLFCEIVVVMDLELFCFIVVENVGGVFRIGMVVFVVVIFLFLIFLILFLFLLFFLLLLLVMVIMEMDNRVKRRVRYLI